MTLNLIYGEPVEPLTTFNCGAAALLYWEVEIGVGEWLVDQCEMPPLCVQWLEAVTQHGATQDHAMLKLLGRKPGAGVLARLGVAAEVGMALRAKPVEGASHVHLFFGAHVKERQVDGGSSGVAALGHDILLVEEHALVQVGIEIGFHAGVAHVGSLSHEMVYALLGPIGVIYLQPVALTFDIIAHSAQAVGSLTRQQCRRCKIAVDACADEVVGAEVANLQYRIRHGICEGDELRRDGARGGLEISTCQYRNAYCSE